MTQFSKWKTIGYAAAIFVTGGISGGALGIYETKSHFYVPPPPHDMALRIQHRLQVRLGLSPDQMAKINPIIESAASDILTIRTEAAQRVNKVFDDSYAQVSAILTPDQRVELDKIQKERHEKMQRWPEGRRHPGGPQNSPGPGSSAP